MDLKTVCLCVNWIELA